MHLIQLGGVALLLYASGTGCHRPLSEVSHPTSRTTGEAEEAVTRPYKVVLLFNGADVTSTELLSRAEEVLKLRNISLPSGASASIMHGWTSFETNACVVRFTSPRSPEYVSVRFDSYGIVSQVRVGEWKGLR